MDATYDPVESPWVGKTVRVLKGVFADQVGTIVRVDRRNPDTFNDGPTYWIELGPNFRVACKLGTFDNVI